MIAYLDLIALPYELGGTDPARALDCRGVALEAFRRAGLELTPADFEPGAEGWEPVGLDCLEPMDVVAADPEGLGYVTGVGVVLRGAPGATCLTAAPRAGVVVLPVRRLTRPLGAYRRVAP